ncbi:hypothetical protein [Singulisphaera sp. PoT]|uniref:hypothetical protein n=1 Tax=Singulisphaera sp. PoT TaxID=3411797 RepID=UPI003BF48FDA
MLTSFSACMLAAILGQIPADSAWLKAIPDNVDVAIHSRGMEATQKDVVAMLKAMSPTLADTAEPVLTNQLATLENQFGAIVAKSPWVGVVKIAPGAPGGPPPFALLILKDDHEGILKGLSGGKELKLKHLADGVDSFDAPQGNGTWFATKGAGFTAIGPDQPLITAIAKPTGKTLDKVLNEATAKPFLDGDLGLFVNVAALASRYQDQIDGARKGMITALDQAAEQSGNATSMESVKDIYGKLFDSIKYADILTLDLDAAAKGLHIVGALTAKADSDAAKAVAKGQAGDGGELAQFADDSAYYMYMNMSADTIDSLMSMSLRMMSPTGKPSPEMEKARALLREQGRIEALGSVGFDKGMTAVTVSRVKDPKKYLEATQAIAQAMKNNKDAKSFVTDVKVEPDAQKYKGYSFTHIGTTMDFDKLAAQAGGAQGVAGMKSMYGGDTVHNWYGTDGEQILQIVAPSWESAKKELDSYLDTKGKIGATADYKEIRSQLPEKNSLLAIISAQGLAKLFATQLAAAANKPDLKLPTDMPKEPALFGLSLAPKAPNAYEFHFILPSDVGAVIEKGFVPLFQSLQAPAAP